MSKNFRNKGVFIVFAILMAINLVLSAYIFVQVNFITAGTGCFALNTGSCFSVQTSDYSELLGISLTVYGILFFGILAIAFVSLLSSRLKDKYSFLVEKRQAILTAIALFLFLGACFSLWFIIIQLIILREVCTFCMIIDSITILSAFSYLILYGRDYLR